MRKIKFRAKRIDNGEWVHGIPIPNGFGNRTFMINLVLGDAVAYPFERLHEYCVEIDAETISQYTGLKDKSGVEIYEGDILYYIPSDTSINNRIVEFESGAFWGTLIRSGFAKMLSDTNANSEVIGNIYENPELLKEV